MRVTKRLNPFFRLHEASELFLFSRVADLAFLNPDFEILAFFNTVGFCLEIKKKPDKIWILSKSPVSMSILCLVMHILCVCYML